MKVPVKWSKFFCHFCAAAAFSSPRVYFRTCTHVYTHTSGPCSEGEIKKHHRACHTYSTLPWNIFLVFFFLSLSFLFFAFFIRISAARAIPHITPPLSARILTTTTRSQSSLFTYARFPSFFRSLFNGFFAHSYIDCLCSPNASLHSPGSHSFEVHNQLNAWLLLFFFKFHDKILSRRF